jgi:hypothetical protein
MSSISPVPTARVTTTWGVMTATCDHPRRVSFAAGAGQPPLIVDGHSYICHVTAHRDSSDDPSLRRPVEIGGGWHALATDLPYALTGHGGVIAALDRHHQAFAEVILPEIGAWLATEPAAADLVTGGTVFWREQCAGWAASTEAHLARALARVYRVREAIATGQFPTADDEQYMRYARVHPR